LGVPSCVEQEHFHRPPIRLLINAFLSAAILILDAVFDERAASVFLQRSSTFSVAVVQAEVMIVPGSDKRYALAQRCEPGTLQQMAMLVSQILEIAGVSVGSVAAQTQQIEVVIGHLLPNRVGAVIDTRNESDVQHLTTAICRNGREMKIAICAGNESGTARFDLLDLVSVGGTGIESHDVEFGDKVLLRFTASVDGGDFCALFIVYSQTQRCRLIPRPVKQVGFRGRQGTDKGADRIVCVQSSSQ